MKRKTECLLNLSAPQDTHTLSADAGWSCRRILGCSKSIHFTSDTLTRPSLTAHTSQPAFICPKSFKNSTCFMHQHSSPSGFVRHDGVLRTTRGQHQRIHSNTVVSIFCIADDFNSFWLTTPCTTFLRCRGGSAI